MDLLGDRRRSVARLLRRRQDDPGRGCVAPRELGLEDFPARGVMLQFSSPGSAQCRISLNRLAAATAPHRGQALVVELLAIGATVIVISLCVVMIAEFGRGWLERRQTGRDSLAAATAE